MANLITTLDFYLLIYVYMSYQLTFYLHKKTLRLF